MKKTQLIMGMPITIEIADTTPNDQAMQDVFDFFISVDNKFSTYKGDSEISKINRGLLEKTGYSDDMKTVFALSEETKQATNGYFDIITENGTIDPSGLVKGWAIKKASDLLQQKDFQNFYVEAGGDIQALGSSEGKKPWTVGIKNPFNQSEIVKVLQISDRGIATSGTYIRGQHIYNPKDKTLPIVEIVSLTVVGPNIYEADRFATAAFAMGSQGITFIENLPGFEGYVIDKGGIATMTSGFEKYVQIQ